MPTLSREEARARRAARYEEFRPTSPCENCGSEENLQWDHIDPSTKLFDVMSGCAKLFSHARIAAEVAKCRVLCGTCNTVRRSKHSQELVDAIRAAEGRQIDIAAKFGVHPSYVSRLKNRKRRTMRLVVD